MNLKNKRVFVSGGSGVIGRYLIDKLYKAGAKILVGDLQMRPSDWPGDIDYWQGDLNSITAAEIESFCPEYFFHLAATFERSSETYQFWSDNFNNNVALSHNLMTILKDLPSLKKVVFASSYLIYDSSLYNFNQPDSQPKILHESDIINPRNLTGMAKLSHEMELKFLQLFKSELFSVVSARIYRSYGYGSRDVISRWVRALLRKEPIEIYSPQNKFDFIYADDVAEGLIRLAVTSKATGIVNLGRGKSRSINEVIDVLKKYFPALKSAISDESTQKFEASQADISKLVKLTSWSPSQDLEQVIPKIIEYEKNHLNGNSSIKSNLLITSISNKIPLIREVKKALRKATNSVGILYGGDSDPECSGRHFVDIFWKMPRISNLTTQNLIQYCRNNNINMIIPTRDSELKFFGDIRNLLAEKGIQVMVSDAQTISECSDKYEFYLHSLKNKSFAIPTYLESSQVKEDKVVVKERLGAGSRKIGLNITKLEAKTIAENMESPVFQPFVEGQEISVDAYIDKNREVKGIIMRERTLVINGESQTTTTHTNPELEKLALKFFSSHNFYGHVMFQVMVDKFNKFSIIECNPRFGGASTLSIAAGLDSFYWFILESLGQDLSNYEFKKSTRHLRQIRYKADLVIAI